MDGIIETLSHKPIRQRVDLTVSERGRFDVSRDFNLYLHAYYQLELICFILECEAIPLEQDLPQPPLPPETRKLYNNFDLEQTAFNWARCVMYCQKFAMNCEETKHPVLRRVVRLLAGNPDACAFFDGYVGESLLDGSALGELVVNERLAVGSDYDI